MLIRQSRSNAKEIVPYQPEILSEVGGEAVFWTFTRKSSHFERIWADPNAFQWVLARSASPDGYDVEMWAEIPLSVDKRLPRSAVRVTNSIEYIARSERP